MSVIGFAEYFARVGGYDPDQVIGFIFSIYSLDGITVRVSGNELAFFSGNRGFLKMSASDGRAAISGMTGCLRDVQSVLDNPDFITGYIESCQRI